MMKIRFFFFLLLICGLSFPTLAQDDTSQYKLRELSASEFMDGILGTMSAPLDFDNRYFPQLVNSVLFDEYPQLENESSQTLLKVYDQLGQGTPDLGYDRDQWNMLIIQAWLRENQIDLSKTKQLKFADYEIAVAPRDFDNDGKNEYLLDVVKGARQKIDRKICNYDAEYVDYLIVSQENTDYHIIRPSSLPWHSSEGPGPTWLGQGGAVEIRFEDINADGLPEWVVADGGNSVGGMGNFESLGELHVYGWRDDKLADLTPPTASSGWSPDNRLGYSEDESMCSTLSNTVTWDFVNLDADPALEIEQHQTYVDNWYCKSVATKRFDWNASRDQYVYSGTDKTFANTQNCLQRQAEEQMWTRSYQKAIPLYEKALVLPQYQVSKDLDSQSQKIAQANLLATNQYLRARLALAYVLVAQSGKALPLLQPLKIETFAEKSVANLVNGIIPYVDNPFLACVTAYDAFTDNLPDQLYGLTIEEYSGSYRPYLPENIGCDAPKRVAFMLGNLSFHTRQSPVEQLDALGLKTQKVLSFDLNGDGHDEWLIWLQSPMPPFFFAPDGDTYVVSQIDLNPYLESGDTSTWMLPDKAGEAIIFKPDNAYTEDRPSWFAHYDWQMGLGGGGGDTCATAGRESPDFIRFKIWRMNQNHLVSIFDNQVCRDTVAALFPAGAGSTTLDGGTIKYYDGGNSDLKFVWDSTKKIYDWPPIAPQPTPIATSTPIPQPKYYRADNAFDKHDYAAVVEMTEHLSLDESQHGQEAPDYLTSQYYLRALALQHLGRDKEAIAAFLKMIEVAPNEQWKKLAMLYLEPI